MTQSPGGLRLKFIIGGTFLLLTLGGIRIQDRLFHSGLTITFYDVGQGDSALIEFPGHQRWLIDGGGAFLERNVGKRDVYTELTAKGILTLDTALLSHPDLDHGEGLFDLMSELRTITFAFNGHSQLRPKPLLKNLISRAKVRGVEMDPVFKLKRSTISGVEVTYVPLNGSSSNDEALIVHLKFGDCSVLFTGDISKEGEQRLANILSKLKLLPITVLKAAHHGSRHSSSQDFLNRVRPKISVISSGATNPYGHPSPLAMERIRQSNSQVLRTDFHGFTSIHFSDDTFHCENGVGKCASGRCKSQN